ncbi:MAG: hypothetical protein PHD68_02185 [Rugosibacter sp.]|nr:hypothetical protein [Rugosibacter sp.]
MDEREAKKQENSDEKPTREEQDLADLDEYLSGLGPDTKLVISRVEPSWCKGLLEEMDITESTNPVSLNYLVQTWGGHKLRLRFRSSNGRWMRHHDVELFSYIPLVYGRPAIRRLENAHDLPGQSPPAPVPAPVPPQDTKKDIMELMMLMQQQRAQDMNALANLMKSTVPAQQPGPDPYQMMAGMLNLVGRAMQLRPPEISGGENDEVFGLIRQTLDVLGSSQRQAPPPRLVNATQAQQSNVPIFEQLAGMEPAAVINQLTQAVDKMTPEKQAATVGHLLQTIDQLGGRDILLQQLEQRGILESDEDEDEPGPAGKMADTRR